MAEGQLHWASHTWNHLNSVLQNGHRMLVTYIHNVHIENSEHRNLEIRKHVMTSCSGTKPFYYFWVKGFNIRRETQSFYDGFFIWLLSRAAPMACKFVSAQRAPKVKPPRSTSSFNSLTFFEIPKILRALLVRDVTCTLSLISSSQAIMTSLSHMSALCACTRYHLHQGCT